MEQVPPSEFSEAVTIRFWAKVNKAGPIHPVLGSSCWLWTRCTVGRGYGVFGPSKERNYLAHRFSWLLVHGDPPEDKPCVLHRCDNPPCVNPEHLFVGTLADNMADMWSKGRGACGEGHGSKTRGARTKELRASRPGRHQPVFRSCNQCGTPVRIYPYMLRRGKGKFCSHACSALWHRQHRRLESCKHCGVLFDAYKGTRRYWFCSIQCVGRYQAQDRATRFWAKVDADGPLIIESPCWIWTASLDSHGYGQFNDRDATGRKRPFGAHRMAWEFINGSIPEGLCVCHGCDNRICVRPDHLWLGTKQQNNADRGMKERLRKDHI